MERTEEEDDRTALQMERAMDGETLNCHRKRERENHYRPRERLGTACRA